MCLQQNKKKGQTGFKKNKKNYISVQPFSVLYCLRNRKNKMAEKNLKKIKSGATFQHFVLSSR
jgi:hypothetical protein